MWTSSSSTFCSNVSSSLTRKAASTLRGLARWHPCPCPPISPSYCERRSKAVRHVVFCLSSAGAPVLSESLAFAKLKKSQFDDKKRLVHFKGLKIDSTSLGLRSAEDFARCARSVWDFDRIMFYLACETEPTTPSEMIGLVRHELEKVQAEEEASKMALNYSIKTLVRTIREASSDSFDREASRLMDDVLKFLNRSGSDDDDRPIRDNVTEILKIFGHSLSPRCLVPSRYRTFQT